MTSSFAFVPRNVRRSVKGQPSSSSVRQHEPGATSLTSILELDRKPELLIAYKDKDKATAKSSKSLPGEHYAVLTYIALSDYSLWSDPDLRRTIEQSTENFIPLSYLLRNSFILNLAGLGKDISTEETNIVKALRAHASDILEARILVSSSSRSWNSKDGLGGYEVRRKNLESVRPSQNYTKDYWEKRTIYLENIPIQYRTISGIAHLTLSLLPQQQLTKIQNITLPPHHNDGPGDIPKCKGFALVTIADPGDIDVLLQAWPWDRRLDQHSALSCEEAHEAAKFGLRTLSKARWDTLKEEYLAYQRKLLDDLVAFNTVNEPSNLPQTSDIKMQEDPGEWEPAHPPTDARITTLASPYPLNCLIFVRNVHPDTNKTTLRKLFSAAFDTTLPNNQADGLDYVDFNKGMNSCYLRLASSHHAQLLVEYFTAHLVAQDRGLDDIGILRGNTENSIAMEIVQGKREELYWEKVPEKICRQAVQKAVNAQQGDAVPEEEPKRKRKRDK